MFKVNLSLVHRNSTTLIPRRPDRLLQFEHLTQLPYSQRTLALRFIRMNPLSPLSLASQNPGRRARLGFITLETLPVRLHHDATKLKDELLVLRT